MQRNTNTTLGSLRIGDRFCYPGKTDVWQVMTFVGRKVAINQTGITGKRIHPYDQIKQGDIRVKFLRHTVLEFSDECKVEDLQPGDVFTGVGDDFVTEWWVREQFNDKAGKETKAVKVGTADIIFVSHGTQVTFLKHKEVK